VRDLGSGLEQHAADAVPGEFRGRGQPGRAAADDQHGRGVRPSRVGRRHEAILGQPGAAVHSSHDLYPQGYILSGVNVDSEELTDVTRRLRRAQGQIGGVIRMIEDGRECQDVLTQLAAVARALDRAGFKIIASGLCQCVLDEQAGREQAAAERARLEKLFLSLA
jgi:DNA-binding FrmR family transcriptional regulator